MSKNKLFFNGVFGLLYEITVLACGLILPRLILKYYGSEVNGLVNSITSLLSFITLLELGIGAVVQANLYKPLVENDINRISSIYAYTKKFFYIVSGIFLCYIIIISIFYPLYQKQNFDYLFTFYLVVAISFNLLCQYLFGTVNSLLLKADQKSYIIFIIQIISLIINTIVCCFLIIFGFSIQIVKIITSIIYFSRPIFLLVYVKKHYNIIKVKSNRNVLPQRWSGLAQHIAAYIMDNTDIIILTFFSTLQNVSIYSIYYMIAKSLMQLIQSMSSGIQSHYGQLFAVGDMIGLEKSFKKNNFIIINISLFLFMVCIIVICPFVLLYTTGVNDANYYQPMFAFILLMGQFVCILRLLGNHMIRAIGHFRQTQLSAIIETVLNIVVSIVFVFYYGLIGVAIGTLVALLYRTIYFIYYISKNLFRKTCLFYLRQSILIITSFVISFFILYKVNLDIRNYFDWVIKSCYISLLVLIILIILNLVINFKFVKELFNKNK